MKTNQIKKDFAEIMDLSAEISALIANADVMQPKAVEPFEAWEILQRARKLIEDISDIAFAINAKAYKNI